MTSEDCVYNIAVVAEYTGSNSDSTGRSDADVRGASAHVSTIRSGRSMRADVRYPAHTNARALVPANVRGAYTPADLRGMRSSGSSSGSIKQRQRHLKYESTALVETSSTHNNIQYLTPINVALFSITALTDKSTVFIPCSARDPPDGSLYSTQAALSVTASATSPANTQTQRQYELCSAPISTTTIPPTEALGILAVSLEQCYGHTSLYICADDGHCSTVLPTTAEWAYSATTTVSCQKLWGPIPTPG